MKSVAGVLSAMSVREKVSQMVMGQLWGTSVTSEFADFLREYPLGAYRLAGWNIRDIEQVREFTKQVREVFSERSLPEPVIASDEEGGSLCVFRGIITSFPGTMALGAIDSERLVREQMRVIGARLNALGISMNFSPVCDTNLLPDNTVVGIRAYGEDAGLCGRLSLAAAIGTNEVGVLNCAKHFPGHGGTRADTHFAFATDDLSREDFERRELAAFIPCIRADVDSIFVDHVFHKCVDPDLPASLSKAMITGVLREQCGYDGVVMTDDLNMKAIVDKWGIAQASLLFLQAGGDMAMTCGTCEVIGETIALLESAVADGRLPMARVDESVERILRMKERLSKYRAYDKSQIDAGALSTEIASRAMTLIRDPRGMLPLEKGKRVLLVLPNLENMTLSDTTARVEIRLGEYMDSYCKRVTARTISAEPTPDDISRVIQAAGQADYIVQCVYGTCRYPGQARLFEQLETAGHKTLALLIREPYDADNLPKSATAVCAYSAIDESMRAATAALFGDANMPGKLPVNLQGGREG